MSVMLDSRLGNSQTWITGRDSQLLPPLLQLECRKHHCNLPASQCCWKLKKCHVHFSTQGCCEISFQAVVSVGNIQHALNSHLPGNRVHAGLLFLVKAGKRSGSFESGYLNQTNIIPPNDGVKIKKNWNHHLVEFLALIHVFLLFFCLVGGYVMNRMYGKILQMGFGRLGEFCKATTKNEDVSHPKLTLKVMWKNILIWVCSGEDVAFVVDFLRIPTHIKLPTCKHYLGRWSNLTDIFQMGWNHQLVNQLERPCFGKFLGLVFLQGVYHYTRKQFWWFHLKNPMFSHVEKCNF